MLTGKAVHLLVLVWFVMYQGPRETVLSAEVSCLFDVIERTMPDVSGFGVIHSIQLLFLV